MDLSKFAIALGAAGLLSLALPALAQESTPTPDIPPSAESFNLSRYRGDGFSLLLPSNATVRQQGAATIVFGPQADFRDAAVGNRYSGYAYVLSIEVHDNPDRLTGEAFALQEIERIWQNIQASDAPLGGLPVDSQGKVRQDAVARRVLGGLPAFEVIYFGFDSYEHRFYVDHGDRVFVIIYRDTGYARHPLAQVQLDVYALLLATLRFDDVPDAR